jgi:hypothetical protein
MFAVADQPSPDDHQDSKADEQDAGAGARVEASSSDAEPGDRPDGRSAYPDPAIPYVHGRSLVPIRVQPRKYDNPIHRVLFEQEDAVRKRIKELDQLVLDLSAERRQLLQRIKQIHDDLRPSFDGARGRRRRAVTHEEPLPPVADDAVHLIGRALRAVCITLLREAERPLTLRELHVLLHRLGYLVAHEHPAKALADALGHEADAGRAIRTERATYRAVAGPPGEDKPSPENGSATAGSRRPAAAGGDDGDGQRVPEDTVEAAERGKRTEPEERTEPGERTEPEERTEPDDYGGIPDW